jgi:3-deoxy-D-manno-octulosonic-acid transferase
MRANEAMQRAFYLVYNGLLLAGLFILLPLLIYMVACQPKRRRTLRQRMGWCRYAWQRSARSGTTPHIWVHALSVGEIRAAQPLVKRLRELHPQTRLCLSCSTHSGFQIARQAFGAQQGIDLAYFPYDWLWSVRRVTAMINPMMVILTETDIWPNFMMAMQRRRIPVHLVNLRMSDASWRKFNRFRPVARTLFGAFEKICVQNRKDLQRLGQMGISADKVAVTGNIKFDGALPEKACEPSGVWKKRLGIQADRRILVAGSTHAGEEHLLLKVFGTLVDGTPNLLMIIAPRDPQRHPDVIRICKTMSIPCGRLSQPSQGFDAGCPAVLVVDVIGVLNELYCLADIVFVGGSLVPCGGHNPLEPAAWGKPVLFGPDMRDFLLIAGLLLEARAALRVLNARDLQTAIEGLFADPRLARSMGQNARQVIRYHQGAVDKTLNFLGLGRDAGERC